MNSLYGNFRNRKFSEIFPDDATFNQAFKETPFGDCINEESTNLLFYLLYAEYGNSTIASSDENRFKYQLFSIVFTKGPNWERSVEIQKKIRELADEDIYNRLVSINNNATNPGELGVSTGELGEVFDYVNSQNVTKQRGAKADALFSYLTTLEDVTSSFIAEFKRLFIKIVEPELPLWYVSEEE